MNFSKYFLLALIIGINSCSGSMSKDKQERFKVLKLESERKVQKWIKEHSRFSESYVPDTFFNFIVTYSNESNNEPSSFLIKHKFSLRNKDSILSEMSCYFELNKRLYVTAVSEDFSKSNGRDYSYKGGLYLEDWFNKNGGTYTLEDSLEIFKDKSIPGYFLYKTNGAEEDENEGTYLSGEQAEIIKQNAEAIIEDKNMPEIERQKRVQTILKEVKKANK